MYMYHLPFISEVNHVSILKLVVEHDIYHGILLICILEYNIPWFNLLISPSGVSAQHATTMG